MSSEIVFSLDLTFKDFRGPRLNASSTDLWYHELRTPTNAPTSHLPARDFFRTLCKAFRTHFCRRWFANCRLIRLPILKAVSMNCMHQLRAHQDQLFYELVAYGDVHIAIPRAPEFSKSASWSSMCSKRSNDSDPEAI